MKEFEEFSKKFDFERYIYQFSSVAMETKTLSLDFSNETKKWKRYGKKQGCGVWSLAHLGRQFGARLQVRLRSVTREVRHRRVRELLTGAFSACSRSGAHTPANWAGPACLVRLFHFCSFAPLAPSFILRQILFDAR